jgi:hypothetical protein
MEFPMIRVTATPKSNEDLYGLLVAKEVQLRQKNQGTLHRKGEKKRGNEKWTHATYPGWVRFQKCLGGVLVAQIHSKIPDGESQLLQAFIGFLDRHFRQELGTVAINYGAAD